MKKLNQKGFTLIELLIVIVIIGILAGVVLQIIDPAKQQNRAKDGVTKATMEKVTLAAGAFNAAYGNYPTDAELEDEIENEVNFVADGTSATFDFDNGANYIYTPSPTSSPTSFTLYADALGLTLDYKVYGINEKGVFTKCEGTIDAPVACVGL